MYRQQLPISLTVRHASDELNGKSYKIKKPYDTAGI
jgi:hypothetical protein